MFQGFKESEIPEEGPLEPECGRRLGAATCNHERDYPSVAA